MLPTQRRIANVPLRMKRCGRKNEVCCRPTTLSSENRTPGGCSHQRFPNGLWTQILRTMALTRSLRLALTAATRTVCHSVAIDFLAMPDTIQHDVAMNDIVPDLIGADLQAPLADPFALEFLHERRGLEPCLRAVHSARADALIRSTSPSRSCSPSIRRRAAECGSWREPTGSHSQA